MGNSYSQIWARYGQRLQISQIWTQITDKDKLDMDNSYKLSRYGLKSQIRIS